MKRWFYVCVALCLLLMSPVLMGYTNYTVGDGINWLVHYVEDWDGIISEDGVQGDPDLIVTMVASNVDIAAGESHDFEIGDISGYWEVYAVFLATTFDTATVYIGTSDTPGWATGNTAYFDRDPSTVAPDHWSLDDGIGTYGTCVPLMNTYGTFLIGPYGVGRVTADAGDNIVGLTIIIKKRK